MIIEDSKFYNNYAFLSANLVSMIQSNITISSTTFSNIGNPLNFSQLIIDNVESGMINAN